MMRCYSCNRNLSDYESTIKSKSTGDYLDMCKKCLTDLEIPYIESRAAHSSVDMEEDESI